MKHPYKINSNEDYINKYNESVENPEKFWGDIASSFLWQKRWDRERKRVAWGRDVLRRCGLGGLKGVVLVQGLKMGLVGGFERNWWG